MRVCDIAICVCVCVRVRVRILLRSMLYGSQTQCVLVRPSASLGVSVRKNDLSPQLPGKIKTSST